MKHGGAIDLLMARGTATMRELCAAEEIDVSDGPPFALPHPIFALAVDLERAGAKRLDSTPTLETRWRLSAIQRAGKGQR